MGSFVEAASEVERPGVGIAGGERGPFTVDALSGGERDSARLRLVGFEVDEREAVQDAVGFEELAEGADEGSLALGFIELAGAFRHFSCAVTNSGNGT